MTTAERPDFRFASVFNLWRTDGSAGKCNQCGHRPEDHGIEGPYLLCDVCSPGRGPDAPECAAVIASFDDDG